MSDETRVLVTGGAGYIGSHAVLALRSAGMSVVVIDNLSTGRRSAVPQDVPLVVGDVSDSRLVADTLARHAISAVMHFAGSIVVPDSIRDPLGYYQNNACASRALIATCVEYGVQRFIFSSTAAVYGIPAVVPVPETAPTLPINPYGTSKLMTEWILRDTGSAHNLRHACLRYFNVAGADPDGRSGQSTREPTHLIEASMHAALGLRAGIEIFGDDYDTCDGTCIRDFIHVSDLAEAHVLALHWLARGGRSEIFNLGNQRGHSVREVVETVQRVTRRRFKVRIGQQRAGDPACLIATAEKARQILGWRPCRTQLETIIADAWHWHEQEYLAIAS